MNRVQNPVDYIRAQRAHAARARRTLWRGFNIGVLDEFQINELKEIRRFHVLAAWTTRQYYRRSV